MSLHVAGKCSSPLACLVNLCPESKRGDADVIAHMLPPVNVHTCAHMHAKLHEALTVGWGGMDKSRACFWVLT